MAKSATRVSLARREEESRSKEMAGEGMKRFIKLNGAQTETLDGDKMARD